MNSQNQPVIVGSGSLRYQALDSWHQFPAGWSLVEVAGVATDSKDRVYVFNRGQHPVIVFEPDGRFACSWGEGLFVRPHGIHIGPDDAVYCTDDLDHTVRKFTLEGKLLLILGTRGRGSDTGVVNRDYRTIQRVGPPFHQPTNLALNRAGEMYVTDGYGNARVHKFSADGRLLFSWGEPGDGPGQFHLPHGIALDSQETVYVADRENDRLQLFDRQGKFLAVWDNVERPAQVFIDARDTIYVAEIGWKVGLFPGAVPPRPNPVGGRVSIFNRHGELLARWGGGQDSCAPGDFYAPHDIWMDSRCDLYVGEVTMSAGGNRGLVSAECHCLQKFVRQT